MANENNLAVVGQVAMLSGATAPANVYDKLVSVNQVKILKDSLDTSGGEGVTTVDLPTCPASISAAPSNKSVTINLGYSNTNFVSGVDLRYKTGGYPASPTDGNVINATGAATKILVPNLVTNTTYYFRAFLYREIDGIKYYQTDPTHSTVNATPSSVTVSGITPAVMTDDYLVIDKSGSFTLSSPAFKTIVAYLVGGGSNGGDGAHPYSDTDNGSGGSGGDGGYYKRMTLSVNATNNCVSSIGSGGSNTTSLSVNGTSFSSKTGGTRQYGGGGGATSDFNGKNPNGTDGKTGLLTPYGYIGSSGGGGGGGALDAYGGNGGKGGKGAGNGGSGKNMIDYDYVSGNGANATNYGCGGGGGGGEAWDDTGYGKGGKGKQGCIIISWNESGVS